MHRRIILPPDYPDQLPLGTRPRRLVLTIPEPLPRTQADVQVIRGKRGRAAYRKRWHRRIAEIARVEERWRGHALKQVRIIYTRHSAREPEYDNLVYSFKAVQDGLVATRIIENDHNKTIVSRAYFWKRAPAKAGFITVDVTEVF